MMMHVRPGHTESPQVSILRLLKTAFGKDLTEKEKEENYIFKIYHLDN